MNKPPAGRYLAERVGDNCYFVFQYRRGLMDSKVDLSLASLVCASTFASLQQIFMGGVDRTDKLKKLYRLE